MKRLTKAETYLLAERVRSALQEEYISYRNYRCPICESLQQGKYLRTHLVIEHLKRKGVRNQLFPGVPYSKLKRLAQRSRVSKRLPKPKRKGSLFSRQQKSSSPGKRGKKRRVLPVLDPDSIRSPAGGGTWATPRKKKP